jgi:pyruvate ferredoxin oxidoreductase gamma subunit
MKEVIVFDRAGQGAITTAQVLGSAMIKAGQHAYAFPYFGAARMGAPMNAFLRYDTKPIRLRNQVNAADYSLIVDESLFLTKDPAAQLKTGGIALIASDKQFTSPAGKQVIAVPAVRISTEIAGRPLANTVLLGAFAAATKEITLEKLNEAMKERFKANLYDVNVKLAQAGYDFIASKK